MAELSKQALQVANNTDFPNNSTGYITPAILRSFNTNMIDSTVNQAVYTSNSSSWNSSISQLNSFTSSQQPQFISLNAFTASQLLINSGYNSATQSLDISITGLQSQTAQLSAFTSSINEIRDGGVLQGYSTRFYFGGLVSASIIANVDGAIASIDILSDNTKLDTGSFNTYTASVATLLPAYSASQAIWNASATASISQLLSFSSSLDATYATDAQLATVSSSLNNNINTKLNTSSFNEYTSSFGSLASLNLFSASINSYTASNNTKWTTIGLLTGSYATTGSNVFTGSQTITGSVLGNIVPLTITSQTASMDLSKGNFFTLTLVSGSSTRLSASNIKEGQTINLLVTQASVGSGSLTYDSTFKFSPGNQYTASVASSSKDILTFITFDNSTIYASAIKNLV
jgi:hypothetical protein